MMRSLSAFVLVGLLGACSRKESSTSKDASVDGPPLSMAPDAAPVVASVPDAGFTLTTVPAVEARRSRVARLSDDASLAGARGLLEKQFAGAAGPFDVATAELTALGRRAVLVSEAGKPNMSDARPIALVLDENNAVLWSRERPIAGILAPVGPIAIAAAPLGRVALAACDPPTGVVALRLWDDDGSPFADFQALSGVESCDALSLLYWPRRGWIVVTARAGVTRARLLSESGAPAWGEGLDLGVRSKPGAVAAPSLAADTDDSFVLVQMVQPDAAEGSPFHALAFRYDSRGTAIWKAAVDLGALSRAPAPGERVKLAPTSPGVRVTLPSGAEMDLRPSGDRVSRPRAQP
ncbi:MAG: hypothetical protein K0S65_2135 [Labilithrix sp.]|nr:hypothetical protein [Labilithrix sp.]